MTQRRGLLLAALAGVAIVATLVLVPVATQGGADGSSLSRGARGWLVARRYLEERGVATRLHDRDLAELPARPGVLVLAFPWQRFGAFDEERALDLFLQKGGTLVLAYSGDALPSTETALFAHFGLSWQNPRGKPPLPFLRWRRFASEEWSLTAGDGLARRVSMRAPTRLPDAPKGADVWFRGPQERPVVFAFGRGRGRVVALPSDVLANARLSGPGNADLLERLRAELGGPWTFDEFHHGLLAPERTTPGSQRVLDLYLLHLLFLYALTAWALARRFGTPWREAPVVTSSARGFLVGLGSLHDRLGHHADAAARLVDRVREVDPRLRFTTGTLPRDKDGFLALARRLGRLQTRREKAE